MQKRAPGLPLPQAEVPRPPTPPGFCLNRMTTQHPRHLAHILNLDPDRYLDPVLDLALAYFFTFFFIGNRRSPAPRSSLPRLSPSPVLPPRPLPSRPELTRHLISMHAKLQTASGPNAFTLRLPVSSSLNIPEWRHRLHNYPDQHLCDFLEFGWPVGYTSSSAPVSSSRNHGSATAQPSIVQSFLVKECALGATCGPFKANPLTTDLTVPPFRSHTAVPVRLALLWI